VRDERLRASTSPAVAQRWAPTRALQETNWASHRLTRPSSPRRRRYGITVGQVVFGKASDSTKDSRFGNASGFVNATSGKNPPKASSAIQRTLAHRSIRRWWAGSTTLGRARFDSTRRSSCALTTLPHPCPSPGGRGEREWASQLVRMHYGGRQYCQTKTERGSLEWGRQV